MKSFFLIQLFFIFIFENPHVVATEVGFIKKVIPYLVSIQKLEDNRFHHICGGSIINESVILSAGHCFDNIFSPRDLSVVVGVHKLYTDEGQRYRVKRILLPFHYRKHMIWGDDAACLVLSHKIELGDGKAALVKFRAKELPKDDSTLHLYGWGTGKDLYMQSLKKIGFETCQKKENFYLLTHSEFCARSLEGRGVCDGDSGSPLMNADRTLQVGIMSYGKSFCKAHYPYAFTDVIKQIPFIDKVLSQL